MATTVTVIQDIELESTIKVVADGAGGGAATIDINALSGAAAANNLVAITGIKSSCVTHSDAAAAGYTIGWVGGRFGCRNGRRMCRLAKNMDPNDRHWKYYSNTSSSRGEIYPNFIAKKGSWICRDRTRI